MSSGLDSFHRILKDENRRRIILLLNENACMGYVDMMKALEITNTGKMNYHLKVLGDLLQKNKEGQYVLTEKGKVAARLLLEFPDENNLGKKPKWWRRFWITAGTIAAIYLAANFAAYFLGYIELNRLLQSLLWTVAAIGISYMLEHITGDVLPQKSMSTINKVGYFARGIVIGFLLWLAVIFVLDRVGVSRVETSSVVLLLIICCFIGQAINKWQIKRGISQFN